MNILIRVLCLLQLFALFSSAAAKLSWTVVIKDEPVKKSGTPGPREGHAAVAFGNLLYTFGGCNLEGDCFNDLHVFHRATGSWSEVVASGDLPSIRRDLTVTPLQNDILLFGGANNDGSFNDVYKFDTRENRWLLGEPIRNFRPEARSGHSAATDGSGKTYIFGGYNSEGAFLNDLWVLDTNVDAEYINEDAFPVAFRLVNATGSLPSSRESSSLTYVDGKLYLFGGYGPDGIKPNDLHVFDIQRNEWQHVPGTKGPNPREGHAGIRNGKGVVIFGGCDITRGVNYCYNDVWNLDTETLIWTLLSDHNEKFIPRESHTATFVSGGRAILVGGSKGGKHIFSDVLEVSGFDMCGDPVLRCSGHGRCYEVGCSCDIGYGSHDCGEYLTCPNDCHNNGVCLKGVCTCFPGYIGPTCFSMVPCPGSGRKGECNGNGTCSSRNKCHCKPGFFGDACEFGTGVETPKTVTAKAKSGSGISQQHEKGLYDTMKKDIEKYIPLAQRERGREPHQPHEVLSSGVTLGKHSNSNTLHSALKAEVLGAIDFGSSEESGVAPLPLRIIMTLLCIASGGSALAGIIFLNSKRKANL